MNLYNLIRERLKFFGVQPLAANQSKESLVRRLVVLFFFTLWTFSSIVHLSSEVVTFQEYADAFYTSITALVTGCYFAAFTSNMGQVFNLMDNFDNFIAKCK